MVRLVFRPYTQIWRSICTSEPLRASTRVSSGFTLFRHSSPSFGSQQLCSYSNPSEDIWIGRWCALAGSHLRSLSLRAWVWHPNTRIDVRLLGPCFKTGRLQPLCQHPSRSAVLGPGWPHCTPGYKTPRRELHSRGLYPAARTDAGLNKDECTAKNNGWSPEGRSGCKRFPFNNFTYCLTLFPKCFSSFDHSTCALSVSGRYLALDEIYHPFWAAFPNNSTRRRGFTWGCSPVAYGILTLYDVLFQGT